MMLEQSFITKLYEEKLRHTANGTKYDDIPENRIFICPEGNKVLVIDQPNDPEANVFANLYRKDNGIWILEYHAPLKPFIEQLSLVDFFVDGWIEDGGNTFVIRLCNFGIEKVGLKLVYKLNAKGDVFKLVQRINTGRIEIGKKQFFLEGDY